MRAADIVNLLAVRLPMFTDAFTSEFVVSSLTQVGGVVTADTTTPHGMVVGAAVNIVGANTSLSVEGITRAGAVGTLITDNPHDFTEGFSSNVSVSGAVEPEFNGDFVLLTVPNRRTVTFTMVDAGPTVATGAPLLLNGASPLQQYNGLYSVSAVPSPTSFEYVIADTTLLSPATGSILARISPRVAALATSQQVGEAYTEQSSPSNIWAFVVLGGAVASKSRDTETDATAVIARTDTYRQQVIYDFTIAAVIPASGQIAGALARDQAEDLFKPICQSLLGARLDSGLSSGAQNSIVFDTHSPVVYNGAYYVHSYNFQTTADLTFSDTVGESPSVAFRDIDLAVLPLVGTMEDGLETNIDLDDAPLVAP